MKLLQILTILAFTIWIQFLSYTGGLAFYIHPRYIDFSNYMSYGALLFVILAFLVYIFGSDSHHHDVSFGDHRATTEKSIFTNTFKSIRNFKWTNLLLILVLVLGFMLPVRALSSATANVRGVGNSISVTNSPADNINPFLRPASDTLEISDWLKLFVLESDVNVFKSQKVNISGFVFLNADILNLSNDNFGYFKLSRFVITCCAVDARPVGIYVKYDKKLAKEFKSDDWLKVGGVFEIEKIGGVDVAVVNLNKFENIPEPANPYLY